MTRSYWLMAIMAVAACKGTPEPPPYGIPAPPGVICTMEARPAVSVEPVDASSGELVTGVVTLIVTDGLYTDTASARIPPSSAMRFVSAAYERAGTYDVIVRHSGYREWRQNNVPVSRDECHVETVRLRAELRKRD